MAIDPRLQAPATYGPTHSPPAYAQHGRAMLGQQQAFQFIASPHLQGQPYHSNREDYHSHMSIVPHATELDAHYWKNMLLELGFGEGEINSPPNPEYHLSQPYHTRPHQQIAYHSQPYSPTTYGQ
ncbi:hypothetical protein BDQ17DRAFT_1357917 [Cyathus striatus]|nr:hypothetical protein BDQ17DRAFT_1357917 [Cyathus striatus]